MRHKADFVFTKDSGSIKKGTKMTLGRAHARSLQDVRKVGKIVDSKAEKLVDVEKLQKENEKLKEDNAALKAKAVKPKADKAEPKAKARSTK